MRPLKVLSTVLALSLLAAPAFAESARGEKPAAAAKAKHNGARLVAAMKKEGISEAKAKRVVAVVKKYRGEMRTVKKETKSSREALKKNPNDTTAKNAVEAARAKMKNLRERQQKEIAQILTPAERAKVKELIQRHHKGGKGGKKNKQAKS